MIFKDLEILFKQLANKETRVKKTNKETINHKLKTVYRKQGQPNSY